MKERVPLVVVRTPGPGHSVSNTRRSLRGGSTRKDETKRPVSLGIRGPHADLADPYLLGGHGGAWRRRLRNSLQSLRVMTPKRVIMARSVARKCLLLRIWGSGVRISSGAPMISMAYCRFPDSRPAKNRDFHQGAT